MIKCCQSFERPRMQKKNSYKSAFRQERNREGGREPMSERASCLGSGKLPIVPENKTDNILSANIAPQLVATAVSAENELLTIYIEHLL